jgi:23S rRNA G2445 N2-methylase RlmL
VREQHPREPRRERPRLAPRPVSAATQLNPNTYLIHTQPGLEEIGLGEVKTRYALAKSGAPVRELGRRLVPGRAGICLFTAPGPDPLRRMRSTEEIFAVVGYRNSLALERIALDRIRGVARDAPFVEVALAARVRVLPGSRTGARLKFRVISRMAGDHEFRRSDFQRAIERGIGERTDHSWRLVTEDADVEFWATLIDSELILAIRLSDEQMRQRDYKVAHIPGSLRPSVAAALGILSRPDPDDVVLDPFCGAGTVLIERAHLGRYQLLIGSDTDSSALDAARENIGPRYKPIELHTWDAAAIPLPDNSVSRIVTNLPWGLKHGSHADNRRLYPRVFREFARLIRPGGVCVMLTGETRLTGEVLRANPLRLEQTIRVSILGVRAAIYVCSKSAG